MIAPTPHDPVGATPRRSMTPARRRAVLERQGPLCLIQGCCRPWTEVDHRCALALGGPDTLDNLEGLCDLHHLHKTAADLTAIAKAKRRAANAAAPRIVSHCDIMGGEPCIEGTRVPPRAIKSFHDNGYSIPEIIAEYPGLSEAQVQAAIDYRPIRGLLSRGFDKSLKRGFDGKVVRR